MRFVTLNLDLQDARVVRQTVAGAIAACRCRSGLDLEPCGQCAALAAVLEDLDRLLSRPAPTRSAAKRGAAEFPLLTRDDPRAVPAVAGRGVPPHLRLLPPAGDS